MFGAVFTGAAQQVAPFDLVGGELGGRAELCPGVDGVAELIEEMCPDGGHFLVQHFELEQYGERVDGFEVIGHLHPFGEPVGDEIVPRFNDSAGNTFDYVYELEGDVLTIWAGAQGSPAYFRGRFGDGDRTMTGDWVYPGGGGYTSTMTRRQPPAAP